MKKIKPLLLIALTITCIFASCKKDHSSTDTLPPITQTGANTFGCLINGQVYVPKGFEPNKPNFDLIVDPTFQNGNFGISTFNTFYKIRFDIGSNDIHSIGIFKLEDTTIFVGAGVYLDETNCYFGPSSSCISQGPCYAEGNVNITRYDLTNSIFFRHI